MTPEQVTLVQKTWAELRPISRTAADLFYGRLFEIDLSTRPLFRIDMREQARRFVAMIDLVVSNLTQMETVLPEVQELGKRHAGYGVQVRHYESVCAALLWTLNEGLGEEFTLEVREAWSEAYRTLADTMKEAAGQEP